MLVAERYRLVEQLGRGAMGEVWRAEDTTLGREVAVKLLLDHVAVDHAAERFRQEAQTAARLNHPNVVAVYDFDEEDGRGYLVMELVPGHSLRHELAACDGLDVARACRMAGQAAAGLGAAHSCGVVHRDVKPGNLLLAADGTVADGTVKVADFGIARAALESGAAATHTGAVLGTTLYLAPERGMGREAEPASDVYALGCVLYEMLCGRPPFTGDPAAIVYQHVDQAPRPPSALRPEIPAALEDFVLRMLAKDPAARPTAAQSAHFLNGAAGERPSASAVAMAAGSAVPSAVPSATAEEAATAELPEFAGAAESGGRHSGFAAPSRRTGMSRPSLILAVVTTVTVFLLAGLVGFQLDSGEGGTPSPSPSRSEPGRTQPPDTTPAPTRPAGKERAPGQKKHQRGDEPTEQDRKRQEDTRKKTGEGADKERDGDKGKPAKERKKQ